MNLRTKWLCIYAGMDYSRCLDKKIFIGLFPKPAKEGVLIPFKFSFDVSWNWFPTIQRIFAYPSPWHGLNNQFDSKWWTGRMSEIVGWHWPFYINIEYQN